MLYTFFVPMLSLLVSAEQKADLHITTSAQKKNLLFVVSEEVTSASLKSARLCARAQKAEERG